MAFWGKSSKDSKATAEVRTAPRPVSDRPQPQQARPQPQSQPRPQPPPPGQRPAQPPGGPRPANAPPQRPQQGHPQQRAPQPGERPRAASPQVPAPRVGGTVGHRSTVMQGQEAREDIIGRILEYSGPVLTAPNGLIPTTAKQREFIAVLDNGIVVVARSQAQSLEVAGVKQLISQNNVAVDQVWLVDLEIVRRVYENFAARATDGYIDRDAAQRQRDFIELVKAAAAVKASDIHIKVGRHEAKLLIRVNGVMARLRDMPAQPAAEMLQAAFAMADASDATYRMLDYQGARISDKNATVALPPGVQSIRLQYNPTGNGGRYLVARLLYSQVEYGRDEDVDNLGYSRRQLQEIKHLRRKPTGINIVSGPTGSGKSTTLQRSMIALMRETRGEKNVITIEDPPEYVIADAAQLPVTNVKSDDERGEAFRLAITAALRSDPDVIMIGEIRDRASAQLAFQAAMTGHQVWCSLHANDAASCLDRLRDMEVESYKLTDPSLITGLIAQRLVRVINPKTRITLEEAIERRMLERETIKQSERIQNLTGIPLYFPDLTLKDEDRYLGRTVVAEVIQPGIEFMRLFRAENKPGALKHWIENEEGVALIEHGIIKMLQGEAAAFEIEDKVGVLGDVTDERIEYLAKTYLKDEGAANGL